MGIEDYEFTILERAERGDLPQFILDDSIAPRAIFTELIDAGLLGGSVATDGNNQPEQIALPRITQPGRIRLAELIEERAQRRLPARVHRASLRIGRFLVGAAVVATAIIAFFAWLRPKSPAPPLIPAVAAPSPTSAATTPPPTTPIPKATPVVSIPIPSTHLPLVTSPAATAKP